MRFSAICITSTCREKVVSLYTSQTRSISWNAGASIAINVTLIGNDCRGWIFPRTISFNRKKERKKEKNKQTNITTIAKEKSKINNDFL